MKSLILTVLYLAKDTVHRWVTRVSSPVARVLVVFFLTLCALCFLGTYVITAKVLRDSIHQQGGDLVRLSITGSRERVMHLPTAQEMDRLLGADSLALNTIGHVRCGDERYVAACTYEFARMGQVLPYMAPSGMPTLFVQPGSTLQPGPAHVELNDERIDVYVRRVPADGEALLGPIFNGSDTLVISPDEPMVADALERGRVGMQTLLLRVRDTSSSAGVRRAVQYCETYKKLEGVHSYVISALPLLERMDIVLSNQMQCRVAFCGGIAFIVGILLTALAGMEYRQNEYIYTLMKSFGIHPLLLVGTFIVENLVLVGVSFGAAVLVFMHSQRIIVNQFFKVGNYMLSLQEITLELQLIAVSLLGCVLVSSIPIIIAANRDIGRVLK